jgi:hypothetical protein
MEAKDIFNDNVFINKAIQLYYDIQTGKKDYIDTEETIEKSRIFGNDIKKVKVPVKKEVPVIDRYCKSAKLALCINPLYFNNLWQFCQFIRWAEKVVFYRNEAINKLYVDSAIDDVDCRLIVYSEENIQIKIKMEKVPNPSYIPNTLSDILSMDKNVQQYFKSMKIVVDRKYGKEMTNKFTIIDNDTEFDDFSDKMLYETICKKFLDEIHNITILIFHMIYDTYKLDDE